VQYKLDYAQGNLTGAKRAAEQCERYAREGDFQRNVADALLAQAVFALRLGNTGEAQRCLQMGQDHYERYDLTRALPYFDSLATYHELQGNMEAALALSVQQFQALSERGSLHDLAKAHLQHFRLRSRAGRRPEDALQAAHLFAAELRKPAWFTQRLDAIAAGNYYEYPWQARAQS